jgi:hypothetical protein
MKMEFLKSGSPDCPLIRLYEFNAAAAHQLYRSVLRLARNQVDAVALHQEPGTRPIGSCKLTLRQGKKDQGIREIAPFDFEWASSRNGWLNVARLIQPFTQDDFSGGHQWLARGGRIALLLSANGGW